LKKEVAKMLEWFELAFMGGYATVYFVFIGAILQELVYMQGTIIHFPCFCCGNPVYFSNHSTVPCKWCGQTYEVFEDREKKLKIRFVLNPNDKEHVCTDCHGKFVLKAGGPEEGELRKCPNPNCDREYYVREKNNPHKGFYVKALPRKKWW